MANSVIADLPLNFHARDDFQIADDPCGIRQAVFSRDRLQLQSGNRQIDASRQGFGLDAGLG
jgi:hypothetical protein